MFFASDSKLRPKYKAKLPNLKISRGNAVSVNLKSDEVEIATHASAKQSIELAVEMMGETQRHVLKNNAPTIAENRGAKSIKIKESTV